MSQAVIGVAVEIPQPWGVELEARRAGFGDAAAHAMPAHITLLPPTAVPADGLVQVEEHLARAGAEVEAYDVHLRGTGTFRPVSPVVFVALSRGISGCEALQAAIRRGPLERELEFPYHPHVTVAHGLAEDALDRAYDELSGFAARFTVTGFALYLLGDDGVWRVRRVLDLAT